MSKVLAVTGFVSGAFPAKHLTEAQCRDLGDRLKAALPDRLISFDNDWRLQDCWGWQLMKNNPQLKPACANITADRFETPTHEAISNIILLQRFEWMRLAGIARPDVDAFAWVEYTIMKQRNVDPGVVQNYLDAIAKRPYDAVSFPGCWDKKLIDDSQAHWRFCGSTWVCPRAYLENVAHAVKTVATLRAQLTGKVSWDMNTMAYVELLDVLPIRWYAADHGAPQFTNY